MTQQPVAGQQQPQRMSIFERMLQQRALEQAQREQLGGGVGALLNALGINPLGFVQNITSMIPGGNEAMGTQAASADTLGGEDPYAFDPRGAAGGRLEDTLALMGIMRQKPQMTPLAQLAGNLQMPTVRPGTVSAGGKTPGWSFQYDEPEMGAAQAADLEDSIRRRFLADIIGGRVVSPESVSMPEQDFTAQFGQAKSLLEQLLGGAPAAPTTTPRASEPTASVMAEPEDTDAANVAAAVPRAGSSTRNRQRRSTGIPNPLNSLSRIGLGRF